MLSGRHRDFRFPRFKRPLGNRRFSHLAGELIECKTLADDASNGEIESLGIGHPTMIETERLLIEVPEQVERFDVT